MLASLLVTALLSIQLRAPETLRPPAAPPPDGTGKFQEYAYTYHLDSHVFVIAFTPALPAKRATVLDALKSVCRDLYRPGLHEGGDAAGDRAERVDVRAERFADVLRARDDEPGQAGRGQIAARLDAVDRRARHRRRPSDAGKRVDRRDLLLVFEDSV